MVYQGCTSEANSIAAGRYLVLALVAMSLASLALRSARAKCVLAFYATTWREAVWCRNAMQTWQVVFATLVGLLTFLSPKCPG